MSGVVQVAYAVADVESEAIEFSERFGAGPFFIRHHPPMSCEYGDGSHGEFRHSSAYGQCGEVQLELVQIEGERLAPGVHHVARFVSSLDAEIQKLASLGWPLFMLARTDKGMPFAFCDARGTLGHLVEIYEPWPMLTRLYEEIRRASHGWDGSEPVRQMEALSVGPK